jgi:hypothetical protein
MSRTILMIICLTFLSSGSFSQDNGRVRRVLVKDSPVDGELSALIESYEILLLDNNPIAYIRNPGRKVFTDSLILISDGGKRIVIFDNYGRFLSTISKQGRGPEEYQYINDFFYNHTERMVSIIDNDKIRRYKLNGDFVSEKRIGFRVNRISIFGPGSYIIEKVMPSGDQTTDYYIRLTGMDFKTKSARFPLKPLSGPGFGTEGQNYRTQINGSHAYFFSYFGDTVYHIDNKSIRPVYAFKYDKKIITVTDGTGEYDFDPDQAYRYLSYFETGDLNLLFFFYQERAYTFVFNASGSIMRLYNTSFTIGEVDGGKGVILSDIMTLGERIDRIDRGKTKCINREVLERALSDKENGSQCFIKVSFKPSLSIRHAEIN